MTHFRPCIDLHNGMVKQIVGSTYGDSPRTNFETDRPSSYYAEMYRRDNLPGGHVIMLGRGNEAQAIKALIAYPGGLQIGGGITPDNALCFVRAGSSAVIVTSFVFSKGTVLWENLEYLEKRVGKSHLVVDLSCKKMGESYVIASDHWQTLTVAAINQETLARFAKHCSEFLVHAIDVEGTQQGVDINLIKLLADISPISVTYAGGVRSLDDMDLVKKAGQGNVDVTVGSALDIFGGSLLYKDIVNWQRKQE